MDLTLDERSRLDFVLTLRRRWADTLFPALRAQTEADGGAFDLRAATHRQPAYPWFAFLERASQKMLWREAGDTIAAHPAAPRNDRRGPARLVLDPDFALPDWYTDWDIHLQPNGLWRDDTSADVYELGAKLVMLGDNDDYAFHRSFTETAIPHRRYAAIVDLGCGFGKSTWPLKRRFPDARVIGLDLAAPCLRLAQDRANAAGLAIEFRQADCSATGLPEASTDLVTSTMLIHELPQPVLSATLGECWRILKPGGLLRFLDFTRTGDAFRDLAMIEHGERNNEPFMPALLAADIPELARRAGFIGAEWFVFDERGAGRLADHNWPARPEWHFPWAVLEAEKPV